MDKTYTPAEVAEVFGLQRHDLANWRRLPADHPRFMQSIKTPDGHRYTLPQILEWVRRPENALYREAALGVFAPLHVRQSLEQTTPPITAKESA